MKLKICQVGEPVLRQTARPLSKREILDSEIQRLIDLMRETMRDAPGVGLAAPQIGMPLRLAVIEDQPAYIEKMPPGHAQERQRVAVPFHVIVNPRLTLLTKETAGFFEGCLSLSGFSAIVPRALSVRVDALNEKAEPVTIEAHGWYARILQHEIDHLEGTIYIDRMRSRTFMSLDNHNRYWKDVPAAELLEKLADTAASEF
ncbi:MAG: peptide deformylase [Bryobacteraceae bacterium]